MSYDNIRNYAALAVRGKRRPKAADAASAKTQRKAARVSKKVLSEAARDMKADMEGENGNG